MTPYFDLSTLPPDEVDAFRKLKADEYAADLVRSEFSVTIDKDPSTKSASNLYEKNAQARAYADNLGSTLNKYYQLSVICSRSFGQAEFKYKRLISKAYVKYAADLKTLKSGEEKLHYVEAMIPDEDIENFLKLKQLQDEAMSYYKHFRLKFDYMNGMKDVILTQIGIINTMIKMQELGSGLSINDDPVPARPANMASYSSTPTNSSGGQTEGTVEF